MSAAAAPLHLFASAPCTLAPLHFRNRSATARSTPCSTPRPAPALQVHLNEVPAAHSSDQSPYDAYELRAASVRAANLRATSYESALASRSLHDVGGVAGGVVGGDVGGASEPSASATIEAEAHAPYMEAGDGGGSGSGGGGDGSLEDLGRGGSGVGGGGGPSKSVTPGWNAGKVDLAQQVR